MQPQIYNINVYMIFILLKPLVAEHEKMNLSSGRHHVRIISVTEEALFLLVCNFYDRSSGMAGK